MSDALYEPLEIPALIPTRSNPIAIPEPYGYEYGKEDCGDSLSRQVGGNHYKVAALQPWDVMAAYGLDPWSANVLKYLLRFPYKAGRQDLEKAQHYIEYLITHYDEVNDMYYNK